MCQHENEPIKSEGLLLLPHKYFLPDHLQVFTCTFAVNELRITVCPKNTENVLCQVNVVVHISQHSWSSKYRSNVRGSAVHFIRQDDYPFVSAHSQKHFSRSHRSQLSKEERSRTNYTVGRELSEILTLLYVSTIRAQSSVVLFQSVLSALPRREIEICMTWGHLSDGVLLAHIAANYNSDSITNTTLFIAGARVCAQNSANHVTSFGEQLGGLL